MHTKHDDCVVSSQPSSDGYQLARDRERRSTNWPIKLFDYNCDLVAYAFTVVEDIDSQYEP